jgi:hypothetical protein
LWAAGAVAAGVGIGFTLGANSASDKVAAARASSASPDSACFGSNSADCTARREAYDNRVHDTNLAVGSFIGATALLVAGSVAFWSWPRSAAGSTRASGPTIAPIFGRHGSGLELRQEF